MLLWCFYSNKISAWWIYFTSCSVGDPHGEWTAWCLKARGAVSLWELKIWNKKRKYISKKALFIDYWDNSGHSCAVFKTERQIRTFVTRMITSTFVQWFSIWHLQFVESVKTELESVKIKAVVHVLTIRARVFLIFMFCTIQKWFFISHFDKDNHVFLQHCTRDVYKTV